MLDSDFWHDLSSKFAALPPSRMSADWDCLVGSGAVGTWTLRIVNPIHLKSQFEALARRAGAAIASRDCEDLLIEWLETLRNNSPYFRNVREGIEWNPDGTEGPHHIMGTIERVCVASADYCSVLESRALGREFSAERSKDSAVIDPISESKPLPNQERSSAETMWKHYQAKFPEKINILDVCWAVGQPYREWKRWMKGKLKDGGKADKAFRSILSSEKRPQEHRATLRPAKWK